MFPVIKKVAIVMAVLSISIFSLSAQTKHKAKSRKHSSSLGIAMAAGKKVYLQNCVTCHQKDGGGIQHMNPPLIKTSYVLGDKAKIIQIVLNGFNEDVEIDGQKYSNNMPSLDFLKDKEIADVLTYVRNSFGNKAGAVTLADVTRQRALKKK